MKTEGESNEQHWAIALSPSYVAGLLAGIANAGCLNWYDKGLYEAVKNRRPFLRWRNFQEPWQGLRAAIGGASFKPVSRRMFLLNSKHLNI